MEKGCALSPTTAWASTRRTRTGFSAPSSACITPPIFPGPESVWRSRNGSSIGTAGASGPKQGKAKGRRSFSPWGIRQMTAVDNKTILLIEDNPDDVKLTLRAFKRSNILNPIVVLNDGIEALDFLFARGACGDRGDQPLPTLIVLDLKLPKLDGLGVLKAIRADQRTRLLPVVLLPSSKGD